MPSRRSRREKNRAKKIAKLNDDCCVGESKDIEQWRSQDNKSGRAHSGGFYEVEEAPGKGVPLPPSEGVRESAVSSPIGVWGSAPRANAFLIAYNLIF